MVTYIQGGCDEDDGDEAASDLKDGDGRNQSQQLSGPSGVTHQENGNDKQCSPNASELS